MVSKESNWCVKLMQLQMSGLGECVFEGKQT